MAQAVTGVMRWCSEFYPITTYTDMTQTSEDVVVVANTLTQAARPRPDGSTALKRSKHRHRREERGPRSKSTDAILRNNGCGTLDISGCNSEGEATQRINDFWEPPDFGASGDHNTTSSRSARKSAKKRDGDRKPTYQRQDNATDSLLTPERSSSPQSEQSAVAVRKPTVYRMPTTPDSLPRDDSLTPNDMNESAELTERLSRLLDLDGDQKEGNLLVPSGLVREKRLNMAKERKVRERKEVLRAARELRLHRRQPRKALVQPLEFEWDDVVNQTIFSTDPQRIITTSIGGTELRLKDFATLLGKRAWLNDEIINTYIEWVVDAANRAAIAQAKEFEEPTSTVPKFIAHNSFFYENLIKKGPSSTQGLMRRKKAPGTSLLEVDSVFVPICKGSHWTVGVVRPIAKTIEYLDSMGGSPHSFIKLMREWLKFQLGEKYVEAEWNTPRTACAHQSNGYDCGVFVCTNAFCVALGLDTSCYDECDMLQQRRIIAAVLINRGFLGDFEWNGKGL
ncbi:Ubiquitin-like-specific protease [Lachnellula hyalina]|uniref:Ubiquitin-like-specific protease n=1 Tax=Lachnellula hyalina TaxID=1316788 RepID=A0A8H8QWE4_9HELO|nr:Ubiquitin-like-specific protease [Lachnellula hyalina]TVY23405.1 Ubiquitin-like-specific protease [Lachnellula hyalina]